MGEFNIIYADPPWRYKVSKGRGIAEDHYDTMSIKDICKLPIQDITADNCILFLWGTWPLLPEAVNVINSWGFTYKTIGFVWVKTNKRTDVNQASFFPEDSFDDFLGCGHYTRSNTEFCLIGTKGKPKRINTNIRQLIYEPIARHSKKPDSVRNKIVDLCGDMPRLELFARQNFDGWSAFGNEVENSIEL